LGTVVSQPDRSIAGVRWQGTLAQPRFLARALNRLEFSFENLPESVSIKKVNIEEIEVVDEVEDEGGEEFQTLPEGKTQSTHS